MRKRSVPVGLDVDRSDEQLVDAAADGDQDAFAALFRRHASDVLRTLERRCGSAALAEDVMAIAFEKAWRGLGAMRDRRIGFRPWVFRIAINELIDAQRSAGRRVRRERRVALDERSMADDEPFTDAERVRLAMETLSTRHQEVLTLRYVAELTPTEIARTLGVTKGAVAVRTHRATAALQRALEMEPSGVSA